ncbi:MAG TPA: hypothetical protein VJ914_18005 [Pseudonocardiaceae bacterium]|nr:hypothetical protein [Pseudonocardiaceae bacterium]
MSNVRNGRLLWTGRAAVIAGLATLVACGPVQGTPTQAPASTMPRAATTTQMSTTSAAARPANSAAPSVVADGTYTLSANPACGEFAMNGASLVVRGGTAAITQGNWAGDSPNSNPGPPVTGSVSRQGNGFHIRVANGRVVVIDLTGTVNANGTLTGNGQSGGVHLNPDTGWVCSFTFTATPGSAAGATGQTLSEETFYSPTRNISCQIMPDSTYCQTWTPPQSVTLSTNGTYTVCTGNDCLGNPGENTPVLAYGDSTVVGPFTCASTTSGVTCTVAGTGFRISRSGVAKVP